MHGAVAVDLGATSGRFAEGRLVDGQIRFRVVEQVAHHPSSLDGRLHWDLDALLGLVRRAVDHAEQTFSSATVGIDAWGVDHGFLDEEGRLIQPPVCYRDVSHARAFEALAPHRAELYALTGIQHQPFNTVCQLRARAEDQPELVGKRWMILPDLLGYLVGGEVHHELTEASTTQLMGLDRHWSARAFEIAGWPVPEVQPRLPGRLGARLSERVQLAHVGSHDTASAVAGFGELAPDEIFLNVGTWSLVGCVLDAPIATPETERANFTNERCADGRIRFLRNVPGFWVINRLHAELEIRGSIPEWLNGPQPDLRDDQLIDLFDESLFNPESMVHACRMLLKGTPTTDDGWAALALQSLAKAVAEQPARLREATGRSFRRIRVGGGGSQSVAFCQRLADRTGLPVVAGPVEVTVLGNLAVQFLASGAFGSWAEANASLARSAETVEYRPR